MQVKGLSFTSGRRFALEIIVGRRFAVLLSSLVLLPLISGCGQGSNAASPGSTAAASNPVPAISLVSPATVNAGAAQQTLTVTGTGFVISSVVALNGTPLQTTFVSSTSLQAIVPASALAGGEAAALTVMSPAPGGGSSPTANFSVVSPTPVVTAITPGAVPPGQAITVTVTGTGFEANSGALWNGSPRPTTFISSTSLQVTLTAADVQSPGAGQITVNNPGPGGSATAPAGLVVLSPLTLASIAPATITAGSPALSIVLTGTGFTASTAVALDTLSLQTSLLSSTSLQAAVPASALTAGRNATLTVANTAANGGGSAMASFTITNPVPAISALLPAAVPLGVAVTVGLTGTGFTAGSSALWNGSARPTTFNSSTSLQIALTAADVGSAGNGQITVANPAPGGGMSAVAALNVSPPVTVTSVSPAGLTAGATAQTLTVTGTGFAASAVVALDGTTLQTTFSSTTSLTAAVPASALAASRTAKLTVTNAAGDGGGAASVSFNVSSPTPAITVLVPTAVPQGTAAMITVNGSGFEANSGALWNGSARPTTVASSTSLQVALTAADLAQVGSGQISVNNPDPGGSTTTALTLTVLAVPSIASVSPSSIPQGNGTSTPLPVTLTGTNFAGKATVKANGQSLPVASQTATQIVVSLPGYLYSSSGVLQLVVTNPAATGGSPEASAPAVLDVINPTASFSVSPTAAASGSPDTKITLSGQGFFADTVVQWNGIPLSTTFASASSLTAIVPASLLASLGTAAISIATPENGTQAPPTQPFSTYLSLPANDIVWNAKDNLIYATVAGAAGPGVGNSLVGIDPNTGTIQKTIFVGSEPNRLAISDDGTQAFVGLDDAGSVRQVNLQTGVAGVQFALGAVPAFTTRRLPPNRSPFCPGSRTPWLSTPAAAW